MKKPQFDLTQTLISTFIFVGVIVIPVEGFASPTEKNQVPLPSTATISQTSGVTVDLTSVVIAALTLGFGYGVLKTFQGGGK